uniref:Uncharacterized protein n=1 Tax=Oryza sativa subsp. japonica TaxID=39947 RepID=Q84ZK4_ORYSJ|nr:hypothetical protein [Oryza sativa Japonica Group]
MKRAPPNSAGAAAAAPGSGSSSRRSVAGGFSQATYPSTVKKGDDDADESNHLRRLGPQIDEVTTGASLIPMYTNKPYPYEHLRRLGPRLTKSPQAPRCRRLCCDFPASTLLKDAVQRRRKSFASIRGSVVEL